MLPPYLEFLATTLRTLHGTLRLDLLHEPVQLISRPTGFEKIFRVLLVTSMRGVG
jgi:hypothetical protein